VYGGALGLDAQCGQRRQGRVEVVDADRDVAVPGHELVGPAVVVERLQLLLLAGHSEEVSYAGKVVRIKRLARNGAWVTTKRGRLNGKAKRASAAALPAARPAPAGG
jgi:hypothetical protein